MLRCAELGLSIEMLDLINMGDVYDMYIEKSNDTYEYPYKANKDDIERLFG